MRLVVVLGYSSRRGGDLHPVCAARLRRAAGEAADGDAVLLSGWARRPGLVPEAELMLRAWPGEPAAVVCDTTARRTSENALQAAAFARVLGADELVVVTSRWHGPRAWLIFRAVTRLRVTVVAADGPASVGLLARELVSWLLAPAQIALALRQGEPANQTFSAAAILDQRTRG